MFKKFAIAATAIMIASTATAQSTAYATITKVVPNYTNSGTSQQAYQSCEVVSVPVTRTETVREGGSAGEGALAGMIIGGILGKGVSGNDKGAAAGAVIGGIIGADQGGNGRVVERNVTRYEDREVCTTKYRTVQGSRQIKNYKITYEWAGVTGTSYTYNSYNVGDQIPVSVSINAK